ncbi:hypothetical protein KY362_05370, partial [Candidatus Woesearchaeota archaeon]|nr:hypothetical protein [Candidatus Woesearchaeota archaeon]
MNKKANPGTPDLEKRVSFYSRATRGVRKAIAAGALALGLYAVDANAEQATPPPQPPHEVPALPESGDPATRAFQSTLTAEQDMAIRYFVRNIQRAGEVRYVDMRITRTASGQIDLDHSYLYFSMRGDPRRPGLHGTAGTVTIPAGTFPGQTRDLTVRYPGDRTEGDAWHTV